MVGIDKNNYSTGTSMASVTGETFLVMGKDGVKKKRQVRLYLRIVGWGGKTPVRSATARAPRKAVQSSAVQRRHTWQGLNPMTISAIWRATTFHFYLAAMKTLLHRFLATDDVCIGIADANRNDFGTMEAVGMYLNLLPLRFWLRETETFKEVIVESKARYMQHYPNLGSLLTVLLDILDVPRSASHSPLFQAFIDYRQGAQETLPFGDCNLDGLKLESGRTAYDISLDITEDAKTESIIKLKTQNCLYAQEDTDVLMKSYVNLLEAYFSDPDSLLETPSLFNQAGVEKGIIAANLGRESTISHGL
jgi:non-ribosomal peptide synthetase component F